MRNALPKMHILFSEPLVQDMEKDMRVFTGTFQRKGEIHSTFLWQTTDESLSVTVDWEQEGKYSFFNKNMRLSC